MREKVVLLPNGKDVYAVPVDVCKQYALEGSNLESAKRALEEIESDVSGQMEVYVSDTEKDESGDYWTTWEVDVDSDGIMVNWTLTFR